MLENHVFWLQESSSGDSCLARLVWVSDLNKSCLSLCESSCSDVLFLDTIRPLYFSSILKSSSIFQKQSIRIHKTAPLIQLTDISMFLLLGNLNREANPDVVSFMQNAYSFQIAFFMYLYTFQNWDSVNICLVYFNHFISRCKTTTKNLPNLLHFFLVNTDYEVLNHQLICYIFSFWALWNIITSSAWEKWLKRVNVQSQ